MINSQLYTHDVEDKVRERTAAVCQREEEIILRLAIALDYRDEDTGGHIRRLSQYAERFGQLLGWPLSLIDEMRLSPTAASTKELL